jgi:hypothetical protein
MRVRFLQDYSITTIFSYIDENGKIQVENYTYNIKFGELIPAKFIEKTSIGYSIDFGEDERVKGMCLDIPENVIEFLSNEFAQPMPVERCCNHG